MKSLLYSLMMAALLVCGLVSSSAVLAQQPAKVSAPRPTAPVDVARIVNALTAKETEFREALKSYGFKREVTIQTIGQGGQVIGEYQRTSVFSFDDKGVPFEKITFFPMPTLNNITPQDLEDLGAANTYALQASKINAYNFTYVGKERIDELDLYVFDVAPKIVPDPKKTKERFFQGRIWVDDKDLQIVKVKGKGIPETKNDKHPIFETYREQIDGRYWFPTYTYADDQLVFDSGEVLHVRMAIRFTEYKKFGSKVTITEVDGEEKN